MTVSIQIAVLTSPASPEVRWTSHHSGEDIIFTSLKVRIPRFGNYGTELRLFWFSIFGNLSAQYEERFGVIQRSILFRSPYSSIQSIHFPVFVREFTLHLLELKQMEMYQCEVSAFFSCWHS